MTATSLQQRMAEALELRKKNDSLRRLIPYDPSFADFSSNDYLGIAHSSSFIEFVNERRMTNVQLYGSGGSRLLSGNSSFAEETEGFFASHFKSEAGLIFNSGYAANCGIFGCIPKKGDTIIFDELIHASVRDGIRLSYAKSWSFRHNDLKHLKELIERAEGEIFVAVESVYSMDGDVCPILGLVKLCEEKNVNLILDEAHSTGIWGKNGEGMATAYQLEDRIFARVFTFGKAMGCHGAFVAGSALLKEYLINFARTFIYTTALPVHDVMVMRSSVEFVKNHPDLKERLFDNLTYFRHKLTGNETAGEIIHSAIRSMIIPGNQRVKTVADKCRENKLDVRAVLAPTVPAGSERLRIIIHAFNTKEEIDRLIHCLAR